MDELRKMHFTEIGETGGECGADVQEAFETAQVRAADRNKVITVTLKIAVSPPDPEHPGYGKLAYQYAVTDPARTSMELNTKLKDGMVVRTSGDIAGLNQMRLDLPDYNRHQVPENVDPDTGELKDEKKGPAEAQPSTETEL